MLIQVDAKHHKSNKNEIESRFLGAEELALLRLGRTLSNHRQADAAEIEVPGDKVQNCRETFPEMTSNPLSKLERMGFTSANSRPICGESLSRIILHVMFFHQSQVVCAGPSHLLRKSRLHSARLYT